KSAGENGMLNPSAIAETYWQLHLQHPSAWSFEVDLRPFKEVF
ncbi:MAG: glucose 1-dehydrogenase, partial [Pseudomonadota bacterium]|nr:glucose 1-dehydrogenase [Pseudomonadota bacterium]